MWPLLFLFLFGSTSLGDEVKIALTYDSVNSLGAREGALNAIREYNEATNGSIQVDSFNLDTIQGHYNICREILSHESNVLFDVSLRKPEIVEVGKEAKIATFTASFLEQNFPQSGTPNSISKVENDLRTTNRQISTYKPEELLEIRSMIHFKSPTRLLLEAIRDVTNKYELNKNFLRVLYDKDYAPAIETLRTIAPFGTEFVSLEPPYEIPLVKMFRRMKKPKISTFIVLTSTEMTITVTNTIQQADMFRAAYTWFFVSKDKRRITCPGCKHAVLNVMKPISCRLHEYTGSLTHNVSRLADRVDYYFYYDLMRMILPALVDAIREGKITGKVERAHCDRFKDSSSSSKDLNTTGGSERVVTDTQLSTEIENRGKVDAGGFDLHKILFDPSQDYHGRYGEFVIYSRDGGSDNQVIDQVSQSNYQDIGMRIFKVIYLKDRRLLKRHGTWFYGEPEGLIVSRAYQNEDEKAEPASAPKEGEGDEAAKSGEPAKEEPAAPAKEEPAAPAAADGEKKEEGGGGGEEKKEGGGEEKKEGGEEKKEEGEEAEGGPKLTGPGSGYVDCVVDDAPQKKKIQFLVDYHPPFIFFKMEHVTGNTTWIQYKEKERDAFSRNETIPYEPSKWKYVYEGFLIDLLNEIVKRYKVKYGKPFPDYEITTTPAYLIGTGENLNGGFGYRSIPKTGAGAKKEDADAGGGTSGEQKFGGLVKEVACDKMKAALMPMTPIPEREFVVDFTEPFFDTVSLSILMKKPVLMYHFWKFITVLEYSVWICICIAYFFTSIILWIFDRSSPYSYQNAPEKYKDDDEQRIFTLKESLWFCITSLTPQGGGEAPKPLSGRLIAATWWLFGFIIIASYTANLAAFLTVSRLDHPVPDIKTMTRQYKVKYAPLDGSSTKMYYERMARIEERFYEVWKDLSLNDDLEEEERAQLAVWDYPVSDRATKIWAQMVEAKFPKGYQQAVHWVRSKSKVNAREGYAIVAETPIIDHAIKVHCDVMKIGGEFLPRPNALMFNKEQKELTREISAIIKELKQEKWIDKLKIEWWTNRTPARKCHDHRRLYNGLTMKNIGGIFIVMAAGCMTTLVFMRCENWYYEKKVVWDAKKARLQAIQGPVRATNSNATRKKSGKCNIM